MDHINSLADKSLAGSAEKEMVVHYTDGKGKRRIKGGRDLKQSQAYPERFLAQTKKQYQYIVVSSLMGG